MRSLLTTGLVFWTILAHAQWELPGPLTFTGPNLEERQLTGLADPSAATHGAHLDAARYNSTTLVYATGQNALIGGTTPATETLTPGLRLVLVTAETNSQAVTLTLNGSPETAVLDMAGNELDSAALVPGTPYDLIFDGTAFRTTNQTWPGCPPGTIGIGRSSCVEWNTREAASFYAANSRCTVAGMRLCHFSEWIHGCQQQGGFAETISAAEWVDSAANHDNYAKLMGVGDAGIPDCRDGTHRIPNGIAPFRCCINR